MQLDVYYFADEDIFYSPKSVHIRGVPVGVHGCTDTFIITLYSTAKQLVVQEGIIILCAKSHVCLQMHHSSLQDSAISFL